MNWTSPKLKPFGYLSGSLMLWLHASNSGGMGSIPGQGTKIPQAKEVWQKLKTFAFQKSPSRKWKDKPQMQENILKLHLKRDLYQG